MINILEYLENTLNQTQSADKPAFIGEDKVLTFRQLSNQARAFGTFLCERRIYKKPVVVFMQKSPNMIAAFLGVVYGGNYYVPLDADMPAFRIKLIMETVNPPLIICDETTQKYLVEWGIGGPINEPYVPESGDDCTSGANSPEESCSVQLFSDLCEHPISDEDLTQVRAQAIDADPLYVVFTSGSTGTPKGVVASHRSVIDYVENISTVLGAGPDTVFGMQSPLYLDACLKEIMPTLKYGATTHLVPPSLFMFPVRLIEYLNQHKVNTICWVASALGMVAGLGALDKAVPESLRTVAFTSEVLPTKHFNRWREALPKARFIHFYGPTEATGVSTYYETNRSFGPEESIPIGRPFANTDIVLLDDNNAEPPVGQPGEICIRGTCLSLGYFGDPAKTQSAFVQNPLSAFPDTIYKTGDLGYRDEAGELFFISRRDYQIKHMGYRIELAEIEWVATRLDGLEIACAIFDNTKSRIILYYTARAGVGKADVQAYLKANLPRYMMPYAIFPQESLPLTPGGKYDRVGLLKKYQERT